MADNVFDGLPSIHDVLTGGAPPVNPSLVASMPQAPAPVDPNTNKGFFGAALGSGIRGLLGSSARGVSVAANALGATGVGQATQNYAEGQQKLAAADDNSDYSNLSTLSPTGFAYRTLQGLPTMVGAGLGAVAAGLAGPEIGAGALIARALGGAAALYPSSVGQNAERADAEDQPVNNAKALALGVPEALAQGALPGYVEGALTKGVVSRGVLRAAGVGAAVNAGAGAAGEALLQQMGDPNRTFANRAQNILNAGLSGAILGGVTGGVIHGLAKTPAEQVTDQNMIDAVNGKLNATNTSNAQLTGPDDQRSTVTQPQLPAPGATGMEPRIPDTQHFAPIPETPTSPPDVATPPAQPGQATRLLEPPGPAPLGSAEPIPMRAPAMVGEDVPPQGAPPQLEPPGPTAAREERVVRPASDNDTLTTPPPLGDLSTMSGKDLLDTMDSSLHHPDGTTGQALIAEVSKRVDAAGVKPTSADDVRDILLKQDKANASKQAADANAAIIKDKVDAQAQRLPKFLKDPDVLGDTDALKGTIYERMSGTNPPSPKSAIYKAAKAFGVLDESDNLVDPRRQVEPEPETPDPAALPDEGPQANAVPSRPTLPDGHHQQSRWKILEGLRSNLPDALKADIGPQIDAAQAKLANLKRGDLSNVAGTINRVKAAVEGQKAIDTAAGRDTTVTPSAAPTDDPATAKKFAAPSTPIEAASPTPVSNQVATPSEKTSLDPGHAQAISKAMAPLRKNIQALGNEVLPPRPSRMVKGVLTPESEASVKARNNAYQEAVGKIADAHDSLLTTAKTGDMDALRKIGDDHFPSELYDDHYDQVPPKVQSLIDENNKHTNNVLDAVKEATDQKRLDPRTGDPFSSRVPDARDMALTQKIADGASVRDLLQDTVANGSTSMRKTLAARLLQSKVDPSIRFGTQDEANLAHPGLRNTYGDYHRDFDRVRVYDQSDLEHTVLHEATHAATIKGLQDPTLRGKVQGVMDAAKKLLTPDEQAHPSMSNPEEFVAEAFSNPDFQKTLDSMTPAGEKMSLWSRFKNAVGQFFGFPKGSESMLDHVMHLGGEAMDLTDQARSEQAASAPGLQQTTGLYARQSQDNAERIKRALDVPGGAAALGTKVYTKALQWRGLDAISEGVKQYIPSLSKLVDTMHNQTSSEEKFNGPGLQTTLARQAKPKNIQKLYDKLKQYTVEDIDPRRTADKHTWLKPDELKAKAPDIRAANNIYNDLKRQGHSDVFDNEWSVNKFHRLMESVGKAMNVISLPDFAQHIKLTMNPDKAYREDISGLHGDARRSADWAEATHARLQGVVSKYVDNITDAMGRETSPEKLEAMQARRASPADLKAAKVSAERYNLLDRRREIMASLKADMTSAGVSLNHAPNFATRRTGAYFAAGKFKMGFSPEDVKKFQAELDKAGFGDAVMTPNSDQTRIYIRTDGQQRADALLGVFRRMQEANVLDENEKVSGGNTATIHQTPGLIAPHMRALIAALQDKFPKAPSGTDPEMEQAVNTFRDRQIAELSQQYLDMTPESSMSKLYAKRDNVQGFQADMGAANDQRLLNSSRALSNVFHRDALADAQRGMREDVRNLNESEDPNHTMGVRARASAAVNEAMLRQAQRSVHLPHNIFDGFRSLTHIMELGLSPIYTATLMTQIVTTALPKLAETHGYAAAAMALMKNMPKVVRIIQSTYTTKDRNHFIMSPDKLKWMSQKDRDYVLTQDNRGVYSTGSRTTAMYEDVHHHNPTMRAIHDYSGAYTLNSEMVPRLVTSLAARDLYEQRKPPVNLDYNNEDVHSFAGQRVLSSQFGWGPTSSARATSKHGVAGGASPLIAQLQGYHIRAMEMITRHVADSFGARGPEQAKGARRFLLGHVAATAAVAGTMGLPGVNMAAGIYDRLADWATGDSTHDVRASYRQYLADTFGNDVGEALAHGVPRYAGLDMAHVGEERILPFTDIVASKQKWEDATGDWAKQMMGPTFKEGVNAVLAARDITNGDLLEAATRFGPEFSRRGAEAYKLDQYGYTDKSGFKFGGDATGGEVMQKLMGFTPPTEANYEEKSRVVEGLNERGQFDKSEIMTHLARAFNRQDPQEYATWVRASQEYVRSHPGEPPPLAEFGTYMAEHSRAAAISTNTGIPTNAKIRDLNTWGLVNYGNRN